MLVKSAMSEGSCSRSCYRQLSPATIQPAAIVVEQATVAAVNSCPPQLSSWPQWLSCKPLWLQLWQVFLDVVESVNLLVNSNGSVVRSEVVGALKMRTYLSGMPECKLGLNDKASQLPPLKKLQEVPKYIPLTAMYIMRGRAFAHRIFGDNLQLRAEGRQPVHTLVL